MSPLLKKFLLGNLLLLAIGLGTATAWYYSRPIPTSPPLQDQTGMVLDAEQEDLLVAMIFESARNDDVVTIDEYLKEGFSPNVRSPRGDTLLTVAAYHDSRAVVARLLEHPEVDLEARNRMGLTAVSAAAFKGFDETLTLLLDQGARVDAANSTNQSAIMFAALSGRTSTVRLLLATGAKADRVDQEGNTALSLAKTQGATEVVQLLENKESSQ